MKKIYTFFTIFAIILHFSIFGFCEKITHAAKNKEDYAEAMVTMEVSTGRVLYERNKDKKLPMASTTKILTAVVAIENCDDLDEVFEISKEAVGIEGSSMYLRKGDCFSMRELLYGLMLRSGNDAAVAIAVKVSGSVEKFVELMNLYCKNIGAENTNIVTVNGLHHDKHFTTAFDLAKISAYALKNETFAEIVSSKEKVIQKRNDKTNKCQLLKNKNKLLSRFDGANGVKTGYTTKAGKCFVGSATRNDMQVVCVLLNSKTMFDKCEEFLNRAFNEFKMVKLFKKGGLCEDYSENEKSQKRPIIIKKDIIYPLKYEELCKINAKVNLLKNSKNLRIGDFEIGELCVYIENNLIFSEKIYTIITEKKNSFGDCLNRIIRVF